MPLRTVTRRQNVQGGMMTAHGFVPFRSSADYDPERAGDDYGARSDNVGFTRKPKAKRAAPTKRTRKAPARKAKRNGRSYAVKGESVPSWYAPKAGEVWYLSGKRGVIKRVGESDGTPYVWFVRPVDGTLAMSIRNLVQAGRLQRPTAANPNKRTRKAVGAKAQYKAFQGGERAKLHEGNYNALHGPYYVVKGKPHADARTAVAVAEQAARRSGKPVNVTEVDHGRSSVLHVVSPDGGVQPGYHRPATRLPNGLRPAKGKESARVRAALTKYVRSGGKRNPPDKDRPRYFSEGDNHPSLATLLQRAWDAGKKWRTSGDYHTSGVANARVVTYGFSKWMPWDQVPYSYRQYGVTKAKLLKAFKEGYASGKRLESKRRNPSKVTYRYVGGEYVSSRKRPGSKKIVSLPRGYVKGADGVYRYKRNPGKAKRAARAGDAARWRLMGIRRLKGVHSGARRMEQIQQSRARGSRSKSPYAKGLKILDAANPKRRTSRTKAYVVTVPRTSTHGGLAITVSAQKQSTAIAEVKTYLRSKGAPVPAGIKAKVAA